MAKALKNWLAPLGLAFVLVSLISACGNAREIRFAQGQVDGLLFQVSYLPVHPNQTESRIQGRIEGLVAHLEQQFSSRNSDSQISRLNQWQSTQPVVLTRELEEFLLAGLQAHSLSGGELPIFSHSTYLESTPSVELKNHQLFKSDDEVQLNMEYVLNGFIVDRVAHLMELMNVEHYRVSINGQVRVKGLTLDRTPWPVNVEGLDIPFMLTDQALGYSETSSGARVVVMHESAATASAISQWLAAFGPSEALEKAERLQIPVEIQMDENGAAKRYTSTAFQQAHSS